MSFHKFSSDVSAFISSPVLFRIRILASPCWKTHISKLDDILLSVNQAQHPSPLHRGDVLEIQGAPSTGKTHFVYHLLITCVLPKSFGGYDMGGWGKAAVLFDCDVTFDISCFHTRLIERIRQQLISPNYNVVFPEGQPTLSREEAHMTDYQIHTLTEECLDRLLILRPQSSAQLAISLLNLLTLQAEALPNTEVALVALDPISGLEYWPDRFETEQTREDSGKSLRSGAVSTGNPDTGAKNALHYVLVALEHYRRLQSPIIVMTTWGLNPLLDGGPFYRQHLQPFPTLTSQISHYIGPAHVRIPSRANVTPADGGGTPHAHSDAGTATAAGRSSVMPSWRPAPVVKAQPAVSTVYPPITYHITLLPQRISAFPTSMSLTEAISEEARYRSAVVERGEFIGLVRSATSEPESQPGQFSFFVTNSETVAGNEFM